jgi:hypothetical protein
MRETHRELCLSEVLPDSAEDFEQWKRESNPRTDSPNGRSSQPLTATPAGDFAQTFAYESPTDPDLALILDRWPTLPEPIKAAIRALVGSVRGPS